MSLSHLSIARKLSLGFCCVLVAVAIMSAMLFGALNAIERAARADTASLKAADDLDRAMTAIAEQSRRAQGYVISPNEESARLYAQFGREFAERIGQAREHAAGEPEILALIDKAEAAEAAWRREAGDPLFKLTQEDSASGKAAALAASDLSAGLFDAASSVVTQARKKIGAWSADESRIVDEMMSLGRRSLAIGGVAASLLAVLIGWWLGRVIARPVADMAGAMNKLAAGDTTTDVPGLGRADELGLMASAVQTFKEAAIAKIAKDAADAADVETWRKMDEERVAREAEEARLDQIAINGVAEGLDRLSNGDLLYRIETVFAPKTEKLRQDFNRAVEKLQETMLGIRISTKTIHSGSDEISAAADDLSRRTEQQAASLEETAATLDEITATVKTTASGALHAQEVVSTAKTDADHSGEVVREAIAAMGGIEKSSQQIGQIIGVIDEIAFQTNLLALNAGVEAARAGDAGRGFAVVASEVRALAQRSAEAAKEIKGLISASTAQVSQGVDLVGQTGKALGRIVVQVAEINNVVASIAASAQEQASALHQVNAAVNQMDQVTQQNAAMVEETTAAAHSLNRESEELARLLGRFEVGAAAGEAPAGRERVSPRAVRASAQTPRPALKTTSTGRGGAARKIEPAPAQDSWEEF